MNESFILVIAFFLFFIILLKFASKNIMSSILFYKNTISEEIIRSEKIKEDAKKSLEKKTIEFEELIKKSNKIVENANKEAEFIISQGLQEIELEIKNKIQKYEERIQKVKDEKNTKFKNIAFGTIFEEVRDILFKNKNNRKKLHEMISSKEDVILSVLEGKYHVDNSKKTIH